jgi:hypothetical protein
MTLTRGGTLIDPIFAGCATQSDGRYVLVVGDVNSKLSVGGRTGTTHNTTMRCDEWGTSRSRGMALDRETPQLQSWVTQIDLFRPQRADIQLCYGDGSPN